MTYRVENIVRKWEITCYKQFLLISQCFPQLHIFSGALCGNGSISWSFVYTFFLKCLKSVNPLPHMPILCSSSSAANKDMMAKKWGQIGIQLTTWVENIVGKGKMSYQT